ncbi:LCP family protein [Actinoplanes sp. NPDC051411]|uniref:LCP family protein n=1 Tax=Actinoplanes sp. NPDC051411 TaxID=3155522 RepID=UPI0034375817
MSTVTERPSGPGLTPEPPSGPATDDRPKKKKRHKSPLWTKLVTAFGAVLALVAAGGIVGAKYFLGQLTDNIQTTSSVLDNPASGSKSGGGTSAGKLPDGAMNLLMLGLDTRENWDQAGIGSRSDTIIIMHISAGHDSAQMISIPRDTKADIPADPEVGYRGGSDKINAAYEVGSRNGKGWQGGAKEATAAVHKLTGISFDGVAVIDFDGFKGMLEAMGGVYMCVDKDMWSSHYTVDSKGKVSYAKGANPDNPPSNALWFRKGCRNMAPWEALEYSRLRHSSNGDYDRQRHQQQLLKAMAKKASSSGVLTNPAKVSKILAAAGKSLKMDTHGVSVTDFMFGLKGLAGADLVPVKTNSGTYASVDNGAAEGINEVTRQLFAATAADKLDGFLLDHPSLVIDGSTPEK